MAEILKDGPIRKVLRERKFLGQYKESQESYMQDRLEYALHNENIAIDDYNELIDIFRENGFTNFAKAVEEIRNDEIDHKNKDEFMLRYLKAEEISGTAADRPVPGK